MSLIFWTDVADEVCVSNFCVFGDFVFCCESIVPVPFIRYALGMVFPMPLQSLPNSFASERV